MTFNIDIIPNDIKQAGVCLEAQLGIKEWAWPYNEALKLVEYLTENCFVILGGDVIQRKNHKLEYESSNWYYNPKKCKNWSQNVDDSKSKALQYIRFFHLQNGDRFLYTISAIASASKLDQIRRNNPGQMEKPP